MASVLGRPHPDVPLDDDAILFGVLTTNLYGLPDRVAELRARCDRLGIPLIEDAATPPRPGSTSGHR